MNGVFILAKRELTGFFASLPSWLFLAVYAALSGFLPFYAGRFFEHSIADLAPFFYFQPALLCLFMPALAMHAWAREERTGALETLTALPFSTAQFVCGKFAAYALIALLALILTMPACRTVFALGTPDAAVIVTGYAGVLLTALCFIAVTVFFSACTTHFIAALFNAVCTCGLLFYGSAALLKAATGFKTSAKAAALIDSFFMADRFHALSIGIINVKDILYYLSVIALFSVLTGIALINKKADDAARRRNNLAGLSAAVIFASLTVLSAFTPDAPVIDATENGLYTPAPSARAVFDKIKEPVAIEFYRSAADRHLSPDFYALTQYASDYARALAKKSKGKIIFREIAVEPFGAAEDEAVFAGLKPSDGSYEDGSARFAGFVFKTPSGRIRTAPLPLKNTFAANILTREIEQITRTEKIVAGVIGAPAKLPDSALMQVLKAHFDVRYISRSIMEIPKNIDILIAPDLNNLNEGAFYAVDQYLMQGGRAIIFLDAVSADSSKGKSDFSPMLAQWGVSYDAYKIVADADAARPVKTDAQTYRLSVFDLALTRPVPDFPAVRRLHLSKAAAFDIQKTYPDVAARPLLFSSANAALLPVRTSAAHAAQLLQEGNVEKKRRILALSLTGYLNGAFKRAPQSNLLKAKAAAHLSKAVRPARVILIGDTDLLYDEDTLNADNAAFIVNLTESAVRETGLTNNGDIKKFVRPFDAPALTDAQNLKSQIKTLDARMRLTADALRAFRQAKNKARAADKNKIQTRIDAMNKEMLQLRAQSRALQMAAQSRKNVLKQNHIFLNVIFVPLLLTAFAGAFFACRRVKERERQ